MAAPFAKVHAQKLAKGHVLLSAFKNIRCAGGRTIVYDENLCLDQNLNCPDPADQFVAGRFLIVDRILTDNFIRSRDRSFLNREAIIALES